MLLAKSQPSGNGTEEFGRIGRPELLVKRNRGCETSHQVRPRAADQASILNLASERRCFSLHDYRLAKRRDEHAALADQRLKGPLRREAGERKGPVAKQRGGEVVLRAKTTCGL